MGKSTAQAIADLATKVSGEQVMQPNGTTTVLDAVLDALTGNEVPYSSFATVADAIEAAAEAYPSGGGGGDFTTATVTIVNDTSGSSVTIAGALADTDYGMAYGSQNVEEDSAVLTVILCKGKSYVGYQGGYDVAATGDAEVDEYGGVVVSGDCTITYSQE